MSGKIGSEDLNLGGPLPIGMVKPADTTTAGYLRILRIE
jgi:hypothetical protein